MTEWVSGNIFIRPNANMKKGDVIHGHKHNFDHTSFVTDGSVLVRAWLPDNSPPSIFERLGFKTSKKGRLIESKFGKDYKYRHFLVLAEVEHEITALEDGTNFYCIYSHRNPQGEVSISQTGWTDAYV